MAKPKYTPAQRKEMQQILLGQLTEQVAETKAAIKASRNTTAEHRRRLKELEKRVREVRAELKKKPKRAQIKGLPKDWKAHWVQVYDDMRERGIAKADASAIAWANVKRYCVKDPQFGQWACAEYKDVFEEIKKTTKSAKDLAKEAG
jgi:hypothetical protein